MRNIFKKLFIPSGEKTTVIAYNSWVVRWHKLSTWEYTTVKGNFSFTPSPECEIFPSEIDAEKFAEQLREAFKLLRITGGFSNVRVEANRSKLATITE